MNSEKGREKLASSELSPRSLHTRSAVTRSTCAFRESALALDNRLTELVQTDERKLSKTECSEFVHEIHDTNCAHNMDIAKIRATQLSNFYSRTDVHSLINRLRLAMSTTACYEPSEILVSFSSEFCEKSRDNSFAPFGRMVYRLSSPRNIASHPFFNHFATNEYR